MKKLYLILIFSFLLSLTSFSQVVDGYFDKLAEKFENRDYQKCIKKADRMLNRNKYAGDPELYLYKALCYYEISQDKILSKRSEYDNAYRDALKNLVRAKRKDKYGEYFPQNNFIIEKVLKEGVNVMLAHSRKGNYTKTYSLLRRFERLSDEPAIAFYKGIMDMFNYNEREGLKKMDRFLPSSDSVIKNSSEYTIPLIADGFIRYYDLLIKEYEKDSAANIIDKAYKAFPKDSAINRRFNSKQHIKNGK